MHQAHLALLQVLQPQITQGVRQELMCHHPSPASVQGNVERLYAPSAPITERKLIYFAGNFNCR